MTDEKMNGTQVELKKMIYNIPEDMVVEINQVRDVLVKIADTHETNIEQYNLVVENIKEQKTFLENAKKNFKAKKDTDRHEKVRERLLNEVSSELIKFKGHVEKEQKLLEMAMGYLQHFDSMVKIEKDDNGDVHFDYNKDFYMAVLGLAKVISLDGLF